MEAYHLLWWAAKRGRWSTLKGNNDIFLFILGVYESEEAISSSLPPPFKLPFFWLAAPHKISFFFDQHVGGTSVCTARVVCLRESYQVYICSHWHHIDSYRLKRRGEKLLSRTFRAVNQKHVETALWVIKTLFSCYIKLHLFFCFAAMSAVRWCYEILCKFRCRKQAHWLHLNLNLKTDF